MNESKLKKLFEAARKEAPASPPENFEARVMQAVRREPALTSATLLDQLNALFPRLAWASVCVIALCVAGDFLADAAQLPTLTDGVEQLSEQWLLDDGGL